MAKKLEKTGRAGTRLRARNEDGTWRKKRSDAGVRAREIRHALGARAAASPIA
jgi:predicted nucleic acid-binding protein